MLTLLSLLQTQRDWSGQGLADRLAVTLRTVRRDVNELRELGYRISSVKGPGGGYQLGGDSELPPLVFDEEQAVTIAVALQSVRTGGSAINAAAARGLTAIRQTLPPRQGHRIDNHNFIDAFSITESETPFRVDPAVLKSVGAAVRDHLTLWFEYFGRSDALRRLEPHAIVARKSRWYVIGWDVDRADWRFFRLDRITPRTPPGPRFAPRALPLAEANSLLAAQSKGSEMEDRWPCVGKVLIELPVRDVEAWIGDGYAEEVSPSSALVTVGSWSWAGILAFVARFDAPFAVVGPEPLQAAAGVLVDRFRAARALLERTAGLTSLRR